MRDLAWQISVTSHQLSEGTNNSANTKLLHNWRKEEAANLFIAADKITQSQSCFTAENKQTEILKLIEQQI